MEDIKIEVARMRMLESNGSLKAIADIVIGESFLIKGIRVIEGKNGLFVGMPREQDRDGKWYDNIFPITREAREVLTETVLGAYEIQ